MGLGPEGGLAQFWYPRDNLGFFGGVSNGILGKFWGPKDALRWFRDPKDGLEQFWGCFQMVLGS